MRFKVEMRYTYGWDDAGWTEEDAHEPEPLRFSSVAEAKVALESFFDEVKLAVLEGDMEREAAGDDYRIVEARD